MLSIIYLILIRYKFILKNKIKLFLKKSIKLKISLLNLDQYFFIYLDREYNNKEDIKKMYINDC